jgi:hypothetical protein
MDTKDMVKAMLSERTGVSICDSGGTPKYDKDGKYIGSTQGYGRHYERNQGRDFDAEPEGTVRGRIWDDFKGEHHGELEVSLSAYHFIVNRANYSEDLDKLYSLFITLYNELTDDKWYESQYQREFIRFLNLSFKTGVSKKDQRTLVNWSEQVGRILALVKEEKLDVFFYDDGEEDKLYGFGDKRWPATMGGECISEYSYNGENALDQDIVVTQFEWQNTMYAWISTHNGCDARGGFSDAHVFECDTDIFDWNDISIGCDNGHAWDNHYGGYSKKWECVDIDGMSDAKPLGEYELLDEAEAQVAHELWVREHAAELEMTAALEAGQMILPVIEKKPELRPVPLTEDDEEPGYILVKDDGTVCCPLCGAPMSIFTLHG